MSSPLRLDAALSLDAIRRIDRICDRFEASLRQGTRPPIAPLLDAEEAALRPRLLLALLGIELEYRRRNGERPAAGDYLGQFPNLTEAVQRAFEDEENARRDWTGDALGAFEQAFREQRPPRVDRLRIYHRGKLLHTTTLEGILELGRQRPGEAGPFARTRDVHGDRLVMAPLEETTVSRRHALLMPAGDGHIRVTNLSQVNPILFPNGRRLQTDHSDIFPLTVEMTLGTVFVSIDRMA